MKRLSLIIAIILLGAELVSLQAIGVMYSRRLSWWQSSEAYRALWIKSYEVQTTINEQIAETRVDQKFYNDNSYQIEAISIFPLPENAVITEFFYWFNGQKYKAEIKIREEAEQEYNNRIRQLIDPALLEEIGENLFKLNIAPINANSEVHFEFTYIEPVGYDFGKCEYKLLLNSENWTPKALDKVFVSLTATTGKKFVSFTSPSHQHNTSTSITQVSDYQYQVVYGDENYIPAEDLVLQYEIQRDEIDFNLLTYFPTVQDSMGADGFYTLWISPPNEITTDQAMPRDIVFVADISSSMLGTRMEQLKSSLNYFIDHLEEEDRFNILAFSTNTSKFQDTLVYAGETKKTAAKSYVYSLSAQGLTNIADALLQAVKMNYGENRTKVILFLTDGEPTVGITDPQTILDTVAAANSKNAGIFTIGLGEDIKKYLLKMISSQNGGYATFIESDDNISAEMEKMIRRFTDPVMGNLEIDMGGLLTTDNYPGLGALGNLFVGSQLWITGRYQTGGAKTVTLDGDMNDQEFSASKSLSFNTEGGSGYLFVTRLWAREKINDLLNLIELYGESDELIEAIIALSIRYQILTPYTAFYVDPTSVDEYENLDMKKKSIIIEPNYPNPFNATTRIRFHLRYEAGADRARVRIYAVDGRLVREYDVACQPNHGAYEVVWDGRDQSGAPAGSGVYLYRISYGAHQASGSMMLVR